MINLQGTAFRLFFVAFVGLSCLTLGYVKGKADEQINTLENKIIETKIIRVVEIKYQEKADKIAQEVKHEQDKIKVVYKTQIKEVIKYVKENPNGSASRPVDVDFGLLFNASSQACDASETACRIASEISSDPTKAPTQADLLGVITEQHDMYRQCSVVVDGWQKFYEVLRQQSLEKVE